MRLEKIKRAVKYINKGLSIFQERNHYEGIAQATRHLGKAALINGLNDFYEPSEIWNDFSPIVYDYYKKSLRIREQLSRAGTDQRQAIADMKLDFGRLYWLDGKWYETEGRLHKRRRAEGALWKS